MRVKDCVVNSRQIFFISKPCWRCLQDFFSIKTYLPSKKLWLRKWYDLEKPTSIQNKRNNDNNNLEDVFCADGLGTGFGSIRPSNWLTYISYRNYIILIHAYYGTVFPWRSLSFETFRCGAHWRVVLISGRPLFQRWRNEKY